MSNTPNFQSQHTFQSIQEIRDHQFIGNYASDSAAFNAIDTYIRDASNSLPNRAEATMLLALKGMGLAPYPAHYTDRMIVNEYLGQPTFELFMTKVNQFVKSYNLTYNESVPYPPFNELDSFLDSYYAQAMPHDQCGQAYCDWYMASH